MRVPFLPYQPLRGDEIHELARSVHPEVLRAVLDRTLENKRTFDDVGE